ncbi:hypothetical protein GCM10010909_31460 [Acidocella aquatica]|uniref:Cytochrome C n=1 Tax=Acidocella aquatica TaxID=1922313 RepID=A0ABQ6AEJ2_9PROT|nr:hypothetical protein [Acidocella aquatica]GLR68465.1 hypothetical protein GCM10010909_31460 [Acidocella aquatica]
MKRNKLNWASAMGALAGVVAITAMPREARAIPAFAAQTGMPCSACHIGFPQLTPFGRAFKMDGYVQGGTFPDIKNFAAMVEGGFTQLHDKVPGGLAPDFRSNNAWSIQQTSLFYGGALDGNIGLGGFVQGTFDGIGHQFHWDNLDIRLAQMTTLANKRLVYGFTFNNAPGLTDLWNTLPAWGYPFIPAGLGVGQTAGLQTTGLAQAVAGVGGYAALNVTPSDLLYAEADLYKALPNHAAFTLGVGPEAPIPGPIPYWRLALQHSSWKQSIELGTSGLIDHPYPSGFTHGPTDTLADVGVDAQYQYITVKHAFSVQAAYFHEFQHWAASYPQGGTANLNDSLDSESLNASYLWHQMFGVTEAFDNITGNADSGLYNTGTANANGKPNTQSYTTELDYYPFNTDGPKFFPWVNAKFFIEDTFYTQFNGLAHNYDGNGRSAQANDVLFTGIWLVF